MSSKFEVYNCVDNLKEGKSRNENTENTVALSCYLGPDKNGPFFQKAYKEVKRRKMILK